uniref:Transcription factor protein n=1 Tax=Elaeophora elaphi TaxID=1147741 RepID=A0A0R3RWH6_9BILA
MGELSNGGGMMMMNEDCSGEDVTHSLLIQQRNGSPMQSCSGNEDEQMGDEEMTKRSFKGRSGQDKKNNQSQDLLKQQVSDLAIQMTYLSHQVTLLLNALHVPSCQCGICKPYYQTQVEMFKLLKDGASIQLSPNKVVDNNKSTNVAQNGFIEKRPMKTEVSKTSPSSMEAVTAGNIQTISNVPSMNDCEALLSQIFTQTGLPLNGAQVAAAAAAATAGLPAAFGLAAAAGTSFTKPLSGNPSNKAHQNTNSSGRRSKYCSPEEKKAVAEYAEAHGPSAAARKFGIPTPVAAYYHRKEYKLKPSPIALAPQILPSVNAASPGTTSGDDLDSTNGDCQNGPVPSAVKFSSSNGTSKTSEQHPKPNAAHSTGSPGFLRGRGRGRPKLIGDELDAELVDYMVQIKQSDPRGHLTASQALAIARAYIMEKAPGLLEEHGGQIKLKLTWAMKLVARISERQKEIEFGLPAGTISNMTSTFCSGYNYGTMANPSLPGGNFMADVVAQNLLSQQMTQIMTQAVSGNHIYEQMKQIMSQSLLGSAPPSATPQILNIRELELPKPDDGDLKGEIVDAVENDTKDEDMDAAEQQFDTDIENQAGNVGNQTGHKKTSAQQHFIPSNTF